MICTTNARFNGRYQRQQIPISVWTVIQDRRLVYQRRLFTRHHLKAVIEQRLDACDPDWRSEMRADQWEDEYAHAMDNVSTCKQTDTSLFNLSPSGMDSSHTLVGKTQEQCLG